jgi:hypothetical protein
METKLTAEIDSLAGLNAWTPECARLEEQALTAARIIDLAMSSGRLHLTPPQNKVINDSLARLRQIVAPIAAPAPAPSPLRLGADSVEDFVASLQRPSPGSPPALSAVRDDLDRE